jgi:hypothetical protein
VTKTLRKAETSIPRKMAGQIRNPNARRSCTIACLAAGEAEEYRRTSRGIKRKAMIRNDEMIRGTRERKRYFRWIPWM